MATQATEQEEEHWLTKARRVARRIRANTKESDEARCHVYVILLEGLKSNESTHGLYVGQTGLSPEERFQQHKDGYAASGDVKRFGVRLLPKLYQHLNPLSRSEAVEIEARLAQAFVEARLPNIRGGH